MVCFDVDSIVCEDEGIDELVVFCGVGEVVVVWMVRFEFFFFIVYVFF